MADIYLRSSDGSDASDGLTWANAKATLAAALTAAGAGGRVFVSDGHAESNAADVTLASPGTAAAPVHILCVDDTGDPEPPTALSTGAVVAATSTYDISISGFAFSYGVDYKVGTNGSTSNAANINMNSGSPWAWKIESCTVGLYSDGAGSRILIGAKTSSADDQLLELRNVTINFGATGQTINHWCPIRWFGGATSGTAPTVLFTRTDYLAAPPVEVRGVDLSALGSGKSLVSASPALIGSYLFENCKLGSSVSAISGTIAGQGGISVELVNCDSSDTQTRFESYQYAGTVLGETTIKRTGGASDGTTGFSRNMTTNANSDFYFPLVMGDVAIWNETTGSPVTATVHCVTDNVTLTDAECWLEIEYQGTAGYPLASFSNDRAASPLATPAAQTTSTETWTTTGLSTPVYQKLEVTFTPQEKGWVRARVCIAKPSTTVYVCPKISLS